MNINQLIIAFAVFTFSSNLNLAAGTLSTDEVLVIDPDVKYEILDSNDFEVEISQDDLKGEIYVQPEEPPEFIGGEKSMMMYLSNKLRYPEKAVIDKIEGRVVVRFVVDRLGRICDPKVIKGVRSDLDKEALRVVKNMPLWSPARNNGQPVNSYFVIPINYRLTANHE